MKKIRGRGMGQGNAAQRDGGADKCVCPECGHEKQHDRGTPCVNEVCPECGSKMIGKEDKSKNVINKPFPNEHSGRLVDPKKFDKFARQNDKGGAGIDFIFGITSDDKSVLQAIRFDAKKFTPAEARAWLKDHNHTPILFEEAVNKGLKKEKFETSEVDDHKHTVDLDEKGNGRTSIFNEHFHDVVEFDIKEKDGHVHSIIKNKVKSKVIKYSDGLLIKHFSILCNEYKQQRLKDNIELDIIKEAKAVYEEMQSRKDIRLNEDNLNRLSLELVNIIKGERDVRTIFNSSTLYSGGNSTVQNKHMVELKFKVINKKESELKGLMMLDLGYVIDTKKDGNDAENIHKAIEIETPEIDVDENDIVTVLAKSIEPYKIDKQYHAIIKDAIVKEVNQGEQKPDRVKYIIKLADEKKILKADKTIIEDLKKLGWIADSNNTNDGDVLINKKIPIIKSERLLKEGKVLGVVYEPNTIDLQGDYATAEEIEKAAHKFMEDHQTINEMHRKSLSKADVAIIESGIARADFEEGGQTIITGSWVLGVKVKSPRLRKLVKEGKINAFSMEGQSMRGKPIPDIESQVKG